MKKYLFSAIIWASSQPLYAGITSPFKDSDGHTNWQHLANWSSGIFIILLSITAVTLFFSRRQARQSNRALKAIRNELEQRVLERTATLDQSNQLLQQTNQLLEGEITQHKETTDRLRSSEAYITDILSSMPLMLIGLNQHGQITQWNHKTEIITGITSHQALGKDLWETYPTITITPDQIHQAQIQNKPTTIKHSQRGQYHFDITIYPLQEQRKTGVVILIDDVTEHILAANMLIQRDKMSSMGELASTMAHDINAPLQGILKDLRNGIETLENAPHEQDTPELKTLLSNANKRGQEVLAIINNLLDFSHSRGGKKQQGSIPTIIDHALTLANDVLSVPSGLRFRDITIERDYDKNLPEIPCFISELQQVFLSLFRHACHALGEISKDQHTPTIRIQVIECYEALWIKIQHNGLGISKEEQQFIFEPFFTNKASDNDYAAGKRLSFSHFIITEQHRGQLAITSDIDVGTTFHIQLPLS
ncbi:MAG: ATP-binding protein [Porticoccus sp.]|nr:ATP-binding protein [Porticoccus sp.]